jgi:diguanylate cyclase (GGDEF)-like protein
VVDIVWFLLAVAVFVIEEIRICRLKKMCDYDPLTRLGKGQDFEAQVLARIKRGIRVRGIRKMERAIRPFGVSSVIFIDVDRFKEVNDTCGHDVGDKILQILADIIRDGDLVVRRSGDEFLMALFGIDKKGAGIRLVEMRKKFEIESGNAFPEISFHVSFSFGVEEVFQSTDMSDLKNAVCAAEREMYRHKHERGMGR